MQEKNPLDESKIRTFTKIRVLRDSYFTKNSTRRPNFGCYLAVFTGFQSNNPLGSFLKHCKTRFVFIKNYNLAKKGLFQKLSSPLQKFCLKISLGPTTAYFWYNLQTQFCFSWDPKLSLQIIFRNLLYIFSNLFTDMLYHAGIHHSIFIVSVTHAQYIGQPLLIGKNVISSIVVI